MLVWFGYCSQLRSKIRKGRREHGPVEECVFDRSAVAKRGSHIFSLHPDEFVIPKTQLRDTITID
jgi:hypothetical protein